MYPPPFQRKDQDINDASHSTETFRFGPWRFDPDTGNLESADTSTRLEPQVAKLLAYLLENPDRVISRDELIESVWAGRVVTDDAVHRCMSILRQVLSPDGTQSYIETITRRGYLAHFPPPETPATTVPAVRAIRTWLWAVLVLAALAGVATWLIRSEEQVQPTDTANLDAGSGESPPLVAVLPFETSGDSADGGFFANGMHEDLLTQLAKIQALRVISRTSVLEYRDSGKSLREIGRELNADAILEGSVQSLGEQIRINVQLIDAARDEHLWAETYDRMLTTESLFSVQSEIARAVADALHATLTEQDVAELSLLPTDNMAAYRAYHEAMQVRDSKGVYDPAYQASLERAVALDPEFVRAWVELAGFFSLQVFGRGEPELLDRTEQIMERVQSLAPGSAELLIAQSYYTYYVLEDYRRAQRLISEAQRLRPSDARLLDLKSWIARRSGDFQGRIDSMRLASELDPRNARWKITLVASLIMAHQYDGAQAELDGSVITHPELAALEALLDVREHRDFGRWAEEREALQREFPNALDPLDRLQLWDALIAARDYGAADALVRDWPRESTFIGDGSAVWLTNNDLLALFTHWLMQREDLLGAAVAHARHEIELTRDAREHRMEGDRALVEMLLAAVEGDAEATRRYHSQWRHAATQDHAEYHMKLHFSCRALGMAGLATEAGECLGEALREPSLALHFIEPEMPFYDAVRNDPGFIQLIEALPKPSQSRERTD